MAEYEVKEELSICESCISIDNDPDEKPCNSCMQWVEGYLEATNFIHRHSLEGHMILEGNKPHGMV